MPISGPSVLLYDKKDRIVTITMNRPERMNALSDELRERLADAWRRFEEEEDAWVAILTGTGDKAFCAGMDLIEENERNKRGIKRPSPNFAPPFISKPVIAAINGYAIAGGWLMAQICDIRIAAEHAELGIAETRWNLSAGWVGDLPQLLHMGHALEIALWGDGRISAQRGYEIGFINRVVPKEKLMEEAMSWAERMLCLGPRSVRNLKETLYRGCYMQSEEGRAFGYALAQNLKGMEDSIEGPRAFTEKRKPVFKNR